VSLLYTGYGDYRFAIVCLCVEYALLCSAIAIGRVTCYCIRVLLAYLHTDARCTTENIWDASIPEALHYSAWASALKSCGNLHTAVYVARLCTTCSPAYFLSRLYVCVGSKTRSKFENGLGKGGFFFLSFLSLRLRLSPSPLLRRVWARTLCSAGIVGWLGCWQVTQTGSLSTGFLVSYSKIRFSFPILILPLGVMICSRLLFLCC